MNCPRCGKEMEFIRDLTEEEAMDYSRITALEETVNTISADVDNYGLEGEALLAFYKSLYTKLAEAQFLRVEFFRQLSKDVDRNKYNLYVIDNKLYFH